MTPDVKYDRIITDRTVQVNGRNYSLIKFNFSLEEVQFRKMISDIHGRVGEESFLWDGELKSWVMEEQRFDDIADVVDYYFDNHHKPIETLKAQIREKVRET